MTLGALSLAVWLLSLPTRTDTLTARYEGAVIGRGITEWRRVGGEHLQVYTWLPADGGTPIVDSLYADAETLLPRREVRLVDGGVVTVVFETDTLWVQTSSGGQATTTRTRKPTAELYSSASVSALAASMTMRPNESRWVLVYYAPPSTLGAQWVRLLVHGRSTLRGRSTWVVSATSPDGTTQYWVDAETRAIRQFDTREGAALITFRP